MNIFVIESENRKIEEIKKMSETQKFKKRMGKNSNGFMKMAILIVGPPDGGFG